MDFLGWPFDSWRMHPPWVVTPHFNLSPSRLKTCSAFGSHRGSVLAFTQGTLAVPFECGHFRCHLTLIILPNQWHAQDVKCYLFRWIHLSKNVFLFLLHLKWIVLEDELNILQLQRRWEMHAFALQHGDGLVLFPFCFLAGLVRDPLWMVASPLAPGTEKNSSHQALFFLRLGPAQDKKDKYFHVKHHWGHPVPHGPERTSSQAGLWCKHVAFCSSWSFLFQVLPMDRVVLFPQCAVLSLWDLCRGEELHHTVLSPCPWNNDKWSCSLLSPNLPS